MNDRSRIGLSETISTQHFEAFSLQELGESFRRSLLAGNKAARTIETYMQGLNLLDSFLAQNGMPRDVASIHREHVEGFIVDLLSSGKKPATASNRFRALQSFFKWAVEEGEIEGSPMRNMTPPKVPENPPDVLATSDLQALLRACSGSRFEDRRDMALIRMLIDTGMRRAEISGLNVDDLDFTSNVAIVTGKGRRQRACPFGVRTAQALDRYLRMRRRHPGQVHRRYGLAVEER